MPPEARSAIPAREQRLIKTLPRKGIRFVGPIRQEERLRAHQLPARDGLTHLRARPCVSRQAFDRRAAVSQPERRSGTGILRRRYRRGYHHGTVAIEASVRDLANSSFTYKGQKLSTSSGSAASSAFAMCCKAAYARRKKGSRNRTADRCYHGRYIWADKFDSDLEDIFGLQDRLTSSVIGAISPQLERAEIDAPAASRPKVSRPMTIICAPSLASTSGRGRAARSAADDPTRHLVRS